MKHPKAALLAWFLASLNLIFTPAQSAGQDGLVISEVLAVNVSTVKDDFGESSDYVELYNGTGAPLNLGGYFLTDSLANLTQWQFPSTNLASGQSLLVWASGRDRRTAGQPLHSNFKLSSGGEDIAVVRPDRTTIVHSFSFGPQVTDRSFGLDVEILGKGQILTNGMAATYLVPANSSLSNKWTAVSFDDSAWTAGRSGFGFDTNPTSIFAPYITTDLKSVMFTSPTKRIGVYLRFPFTVADLSQSPNPALSIRYDDGFVAYLNGQEIARRGLAPTAVPGFASFSTLNRSNSVVVIPEEIGSLALSQSLRQGTNVLAIHSFNRASTDGDLLMVPELYSRQIHYLTNALRYFATPTPGSANAAGYPGLSGEVEFSAASTPFFSNFELTIAPANQAPLGEIRYTLNGSVPGTNSILYTGPIQVTNSTLVRARLFEPGFLPGPVRGEGFVRMDPKMRTVSSDVPLIAFHTFGSGSFNDAVKQPVMIFVHEPYRGRSSFTNSPNLVFRAGAKLRGSSTVGNAKHNWAVDSWNQEDNGIDVPLLGMPKGSEWVFHAPFQYDPSMIHNPFASELSNEIDLYASRFRFAEIYLNERSSTNALATITPTHYFGLYNIMERIGVGPSRVDIDPLTDGDTQLPEISGGYLLSIDREFASSPSFFAGGIQLNYIEPKYEDISLPPREPQRQYLTKYLNDFSKALDSKGFTNTVTGYLPYINRNSWIDFHIVNEISLNADALRLSTYLYKPRNGPITFGPIWDFDRAFGSTDGRDAEPAAWDSGTGFFTYPWWSRVFLDPNFWQAYIDRYQELREGLYSDSEMLGLIDRLNSQVRESAARDLTKWQQAKRGGTQDSEIAFFKDWLKRRLRFMDTQLLAKPSILAIPGTVPAGTQIALSGPVGATLYYTTDGSDPRALHGGIADGAKVYTAPIEITQATRLVVRARDLAHKNKTGGSDPPISSPWSGPTSARFTLDPLPTPGDLVITEINYHPAQPSPGELSQVPTATSDDFEFIELRNVTPHALDLYDCRFSQGISYTFGADSNFVVPAGATLLLAKNPTALHARYGNSVAIWGTYAGALSDSGDTVVLKDSRGQIILQATYNDSWHPSTDGLGFSLVPTPLATQSNLKESWQPSATTGGSPGATEPAATPKPRVVINEVLANSDGPAQDSIELRNLESSPVDISGWFLTDDPKDPKKYRIPAGTQIPASGYLVIDETAFNATSQGTNGFQLSSRGDEAWVFAADKNGNLLGYAHGMSFGATEANTSVGRYLTTGGQEQFVIQASLSLGQANVGPKVGPLVFREIFYHPPDLLANTRYWNDTEDEYLEVQNIGTTPLDLTDKTLGAPWHLRGTVDFEFPVGVTLAADERLLLVSFDPTTNVTQLALFKSHFGIADQVRILGPFRGELDNSGGQLRLSKPGPVDADTGDIAYVVVDEVHYQDQAPWPAAADGAGASLERKDPRGFGNDPANWFTPLPSPGANPPLIAEPAITKQPSSQTVVGGTQATLSVEVSAANRLGYQWTFNGAYVNGATNSSLLLKPVRLSDAGQYRVIVVSATGSTESQIATLTVLAPATVVRQPVSKSVKPGVDVSMDVVASGKGAISYQWQFHSRNIPGATNASLLIQNAQLADSGPYTVVVTDSIGSSTSDPANLSVLVRPSFISQPQSMVAVVGDDVQFTAEAIGLEPFGYRWRKGSTLITGATNAVLRLTNVQPSSAGLYTMVITNLATGTAGTNSQAATLFVLADADRDHVGDAWELEHGYSPTDPTDALLDDDGDGQNTLQEFLAGTDPRDRKSVLRIDSLTLSTNGTQVGFIVRTNRGYSLQFKESLSQGAWQNLALVTARTNEVQAQITDPLPDGKSRLYRLAAPQQFPASSNAPTLLQTPSDQIVDQGATVVFESLASGDGEILYQWLKDGVALPGSDRSQLIITEVRPEDEGAYSAVISDFSGTLTTQAAKLVVLEKPIISVQPLDQVVPAGASIALSVTASGPSPLRYQWLKNDKPIAGATQPMLQLNSVSLTDAGRYRVVVTATTRHGDQRRSSSTAQVIVNE